MVDWKSVYLRTVVAVAAGIAGTTCLPLGATPPGVDGASHEGFLSEIDRRVERSRVDGIRLDADELLRDLRRYLSGRDVGSQPSPGVEASYDLVRAASVLVPDAAGLRASLAAELVRGDEYPKRSEDVLHEAYHALVAARDFASAANFAARHRIREPEWVQSLVAPEGQGPSYISYAEVDGVMRASVVAAGIGQGNWLVVEVHPDCGPSRRALEYFRGRGDQMRGVAGIVWLVPQDDGSALPSLMRWNAENRDPQLVAAYRNGDWPEALLFVEFPVFNILRDGEVVERLRGWPDDRQFQRIKAALQEARG